MVVSKVVGYKTEKDKVNLYISRNNSHVLDIW